MKVKIKTENGVILPKYETSGSAGMDIKAFNPEPIKIWQGETKVIPTGIKLSIPKGYEIQVRPRSGLALKKGITVLNSPGTIDSDYRGDIGVILHNTTNTPFVVQKGDRIAQIVLSKVPSIEWEMVDELEETNRGSKGFGSTNIKNK